MEEGNRNPHDGGNYDEREEPAWRKQARIDGTDAVDSDGARNRFYLIDSVAGICKQDSTDQGAARKNNFYNTRISDTAAEINDRNQWVHRSDRKIYKSVYCADDQDGDHALFIAQCPKAVLRVAQHIEGVHVARCARLAGSKQNEGGRDGNKGPQDIEQDDESDIPKIIEYRGDGRAEDQRYRVKPLRNTGAAGNLLLRNDGRYN